MPTELLKKSNSRLPKPWWGGGGGGAGGRRVGRFQALPHLVAQFFLFLNRLPLILAQHVPSLPLCACRLKALLLA